MIQLLYNLLTYHDLRSVPMGTPGGYISLRMHARALPYHAHMCFKPEQGAQCNQLKCFTKLVS